MAGLDRKVGGASRSQAQDSGVRAATVQAKVGGSTLTGQLGTEDAVGSKVTQVAAAGVAGAGGSLSHRDTIQAAFGRHDVSGVLAHVGGDAAAASGAIGAEAYATGNHVAFAGSPSLHTAAHEAAHVVQQRGGVQLKGGVGAVGDVYEQHADAVADAVVQGRSAEGLLDQHAGSGAAVTGAAVQRQEAPTATPAPIGPPVFDPKVAIAKLGTVQPVVIDVKKPGFDIDALIAWMEQLATALTEAQTGSATPELTQAIDACLNLNAPALQTAAAAIRTATVDATNASSVSKKDPAALALPSQAQAKKLGTDGGKLSGLANAATLTGGAAAKAALQASSATAQDAGLAVLQSLSVSAARDRWKTGTSTQTPSGATAGTGPRTELDEIFKDAGFGNRTTTYTPEGSTDKKVYDWCGMFVVSSYFQGAGLASQLRAGFYHTDNVQDFFKYEQRHNPGRAPKSIWADNQWWNLKAYHAQRGALRTWTPRATIQAALAGGGAGDIRPGDTCLIDHKGGNSPGHIVMVESYDATTKQLVTIEGNTFGIHADAAGKAERIDDDHLKDSTQGTGTAAGVHVRDMRQLGATTGAYKIAKDDAYVRDDADVSKYKLDGGKKVVIPANTSVEVTELKDVASVKYARLTDWGWTAFSNLSTAGKAPAGGYTASSGATVWGVGRPSMVDFEDGHGYAVNDVPEALKTTSPDQMKELAKKATDNGPAAKKANVL